MRRETKDKRYSSQRGYRKEIIKKMEDTIKKGLRFPFKIVLIKKTLLSLGGKRYIIKTDAPEAKVRDITQEEWVPEVL